MNGELAQVVCLAAHGNSWLARRANVPPEFERSNSTFQFVSTLDFVLPKRGLLGRDERSSSVRDWIERRRSAGVTSISLLIPSLLSQPDQHALAAFSNAGQWGLLAATRRGAEVWHAAWSVRDRNDPERRIWAVNYEGQRTSPVAPQRPDPTAARVELERCLRAAAAFAAEEQLSTWHDWFNRALGTRYEIAYHSDMLPADHSDEGRALVAMASQAWVFGGMGSWNDLGFPREAGDRYQRVTRELYDAVLAAFLAGVNVIR